jgi:hypothetical protein
MRLSAGAAREARQYKTPLGVTSSTQPVIAPVSAAGATSRFPSDHYASKGNGAVAGLIGQGVQAWSSRKYSHFLISMPPLYLIGGSRHNVSNHLKT